MSDKTPQVSVIIPTYNHARYLPDAINSVLSQTRPYYEILVVDDGSTDNCREVVAGFGDQVQYIWQKNQGLGSARNTGILAARGELIGLLDADDRWLPDYLDKMLALSDKYPEAAVYYSCAQAIDMDGNQLPQIFGGPIRSPEILPKILLRANFLIPSTILMRRSVVIAAGLFEHANREIHGCEDWDLWLRLAPQHDFRGTSRCLAEYRLHQHTFSANPEKMQNAVRAIIEKHFGPDDGQPQKWSTDKRTAIGGVYRYQLLTSVQRQNNWQDAALFLHHALRADPTLSEDLSLFYDLALGDQPAGYRGTNVQLHLESNIEHIQQVLTKLFSSPASTDIIHLRRKTYGTAFFALSLVAYNTGRRQLTRKCLHSAIKCIPTLSFDRLVFGNYLKSYLPAWIIRKLKQHLATYHIDL